MLSGLDGVAVSWQRGTGLLFLQIENSCDEFDGRWPRSDQGVVWSERRETLVLASHSPKPRLATT